MSQYNDVLYGVEPYTGKIICHGGRPKGSKNGYSFGQLVDAAKVAKGKLLANGRYVYDNAVNAANYVVGRAKSGQLGSRTINNVRSAATNVANRASGVASRARTTAGNVYDTAKTGLSTFLRSGNGKGTKKLRSIGDSIYKTTNSYKKNEAAKQARIDAMTKAGKAYQNKKAKEARTKAAEARGNRYMYENYSLAGNLEREGRKIRSATNNVKNTLSKVGNSIISAPGKAVNKLNNASSKATSKYKNFANNVNKGIQNWWDTRITGKKYKK